jgi:hypothetical protein
MATLSAARRASRPFSRAASFSRHCRHAWRRVRNCAEKHTYVHGALTHRHAPSQFQDLGGADSLTFVSHSLSFLHARRYPLTRRPHSLPRASTRTQRSARRHHARSTHACLVYDSTTRPRCPSPQTRRRAGHFCFRSGCQCTSRRRCVCVCAVRFPPSTCTRDAHRRPAHVCSEIEWQKR